MKKLMMMAMVAATMVGAAQAGTVSYRIPVYTAGDPQSGIDHWETATTNATPLTAGLQRLQDNTWYVLDQNLAMTHTSAISCGSGVHLILSDGCTMTASKGIEVHGDASLTIYGQSAGTGTLLAQASGSYNAAIGKKSDYDTFGMVTINGGVVSATAGGCTGAPGIGGANGTITINGGTVTATGGEYAAGIGGSSSCNCGTVTINGGTVTATGGNKAAGIGGGYSMFSSKGNGGTITINGGAVAATGGSNGGRGIGKSASGDSNGTIVLSDGFTLKAGASATTAKEMEYTSGTDIAATLASSVYVSAEKVETPLVTVEVPEAVGATGALYAFDVNGGWASVATNEVPSNAMVRVVWTAANGKAWENGAFVRTSELVATQSVQTADAPVEPTEWTGSTATAVLDLDTRIEKKYYKAEDILPIWYATGAEVTVKGASEQSSSSLVKNAANTNTVAWVPAANDVYTLTQNGFADAAITLTTPVYVSTNAALDVEGATWALTDAGGSPITDVDDQGRFKVPTNSQLKVVYTVTKEDYYFKDGTKTYEAAFTADKEYCDAATMIGDNKPKAGDIGQPKVQLGVVAQRYPWDGKIDVQYRALYTPAETYKLMVTVTVDGVAKDATTKGFITSGIDTFVYDVKENFGEVKTKNCKVKAELVQ